VAERIQECFKTHLAGPDFQPAQPHRLARIEFPRFNGDDVKQQWIYRCKTYFAIDGTAEEVKNKARHCSNLEGKASQWHTSW